MDEAGRSIEGGSDVPSPAGSAEASVTQPFEPSVVAAVLSHMNTDHVEDCVTIVRHHGGRSDASSARMVDLDGLGGTFEVRSPAGVELVRVPWSRPIADRIEIREQLADMVNSVRDD